MARRIGSTVVFPIYLVLALIFYLQKKFYPGQHAAGHVPDHQKIHSNLRGQTATNPHYENAILSSQRSDAVTPAVSGVYFETPITVETGDEDIVTQPEAYPILSAVDSLISSIIEQASESSSASSTQILDGRRADALLSKTNQRNLAAADGNSQQSAAQLHAPVVVHHHEGTVQPVVVHAPGAVHEGSEPAIHASAQHEAAGHHEVHEKVHKAVHHAIHNGESHHVIEHHGVHVHIHKAILNAEQEAWTIVALFGLIILMSIAFEEGQHGLIHHFKETHQTQYLRILDATFKELTILGFVGLTLMCLVKSGSLKNIAALCFEKMKEHEAAHHEDMRRLEGAPPRRLHGLGDPVTTELYELFEQVHMMIFFVMIAFICLVGVQLGTAQATRIKFQMCEQARLSDFLSGKIQTLTWKQRLIGGRNVMRDAVEYRLIRREFFHPWDSSQKNSECRPSSFDFSSYLAMRMSEFCVELVEIPSSSFLTLFVILISCEPVFGFTHYHRERFMVVFAWVIAAVLAMVLWISKRIYYQLLPEYARDLKQIEDTERRFRGKTAKPLYMDMPMQNGSNTWLCRILGSYVFKFFYGTRSPNKHQSLFPYWQNGPAWFGFLLQICLFLQGVYLAVYFTHIVQYEKSKLDMVAQFVPLLISLTFLWPDLLYVYTIIISTGQMKNAEVSNTISEIARKIEIRQFRQYAHLISELEVKAMVHQIKSFDDYITTGKCVKDGVYEKWLKDKLSQFEMTVPDEKKSLIDEAFETHDTDKSGMFDVDELTRLLKSQGTSDIEIKHICRQWLHSGVFREVHDSAGRLIKKDSSGNMSKEDFKVFILLTNELAEGDFDEDRLGVWLETVLDKSGDGIVSVDEFLEELPHVCAASGLDRRALQRMFKIIEASSDESNEAEEIAVQRIVVWLKKCSVQKRQKIAQGGKKGGISFLAKGPTRDSLPASHGVLSMVVSQDFLRAQEKEGGSSTTLPGVSSTTSRQSEAFLGRNSYYNPGSVPLGGFKGDLGEDIKSSPEDQQIDISKLRSESNQKSALRRDSTEQHKMNAPKTAKAASFCEEKVELLARNREV